MEWMSKRSFDMDIGAQLPHAALRVYVMGERGARRDPARRGQQRWRRRLGDAVRSGALGFSTSRTLNHRTSTATARRAEAGEDELTAIAGRHAWRRAAASSVRARSLQQPHEDLPMMLCVEEST